MTPSPREGSRRAVAFHAPALLLSVFLTAGMLGFPGAARAGGSGALPALLSLDLLLAPVCEESMCDNFDRTCRRCGQPATTGTLPKVSDALAVLRAAVGQIRCVRCICDVDGNGAVQATDALTTLRRAVGQGVRLNCPKA